MGLGPKPPSPFEVVGRLRKRAFPRGLASGLIWRAAIASSTEASSSSSHLAASWSCLRARIAAARVASRPPWPEG